MLTELTGQKPKQGKSRLTIRSFGIRRNEDIACIVTVRGKKAEEILEKGLRVKEYELRKKNFSEEGSFGFGINEHIDLNLKQEPTAGIFGMDFVIRLSRAGWRVKQRKHKRSSVGKLQKVSKADGMKWFQQKFDGILL